MSGFYRFARGLLMPFMAILFPHKVLNIEKLPKNGRVVLCPNHISNADPILLGVICKRQLHYMAKAELFKNKFVSKIMRGLGAFPVDRGKGDKTAINMTHQLLEQEKLVGIFLEGTRSKTGELLKPKPGAVIFAHDTNSPIVPVAIATKSGQIRPFHKVVISFGDVIEPSQLGITAKSGTEYRNASRLVMSKIADLREQNLKLIDN